MSNDDNVNISEHFTYYELIRSSTALANGIVNIPDAEQVANAQATAERVLEPCRRKFGKIYVSSWFRCKELNVAVKGAIDSNHMKAQAVDIKVMNPAYTNAQLFYYIKDNLIFDELIWEKGTKTNPDWVHVSYSRMHNRKKIVYIK